MLVHQTRENCLLKQHNQQPNIHATQSRNQYCNIIFHLGKNNADSTNADSLNGSNTGNNQSNNRTTNHLTSRKNVLGDVSINANVENCNPHAYRPIANNSKNINNRSFNYVTQKYEFNLEILLISSVSSADLDGDIIVFQEKTTVFNALHLSNDNVHLRYLALAERDESRARDGNNANNDGNNNVNGSSGNAGHGNDVTTLNDNANKMLEKKQTESP